MDSSGHFIDVIDGLHILDADSDDDDVSLGFDPELKKLSRDADAILDQIRNEALMHDDNQMLADADDDSLFSDSAHHSMDESLGLSDDPNFPSPAVTPIGKQATITAGSSDGKKTASGRSLQGSVLSSGGSTGTRTSRSTNSRTPSPSKSVSSSSSSKKEQLGRLGNFLDERKLRKKTAAQGESPHDDWSIDEDAASLNSELDRLHDATIQLQAALQSNDFTALDDSDHHRRVEQGPGSLQEQADEEKSALRATPSPSVSISTESTAASESSSSAATPKNLFAAARPAKPGSATLAQSLSNEDTPRIDNKTGSSGTPRGINKTKGRKNAPPLLATLAATASVPVDTAAIVDRRKERWKKNFQVAAAVEAASAGKGAHGESRTGDGRGRNRSIHKDGCPTHPWFASTGRVLAMVFVLILSLAAATFFLSGNHTAPPKSLGVDESVPLSSQSDASRWDEYQQHQENDGVDHRDAAATTAAIEDAEPDVSVDVEADYGQDEASELPDFPGRGGSTDGYEHSDRGEIDVSTGASEEFEGGQIESGSDDEMSERDDGSHFQSVETAHMEEAENRRDPDEDDLESRDEHDDEFDHLMLESLDEEADWSDSDGTPGQRNNEQNDHSDADMENESYYAEANSGSVGEDVADQLHHEEEMDDRPYSDEAVEEEQLNHDDATEDDHPGFDSGDQDVGGGDAVDLSQNVEGVGQADYQPVSAHMHPDISDGSVSTNIAEAAESYESELEHESVEADSQMQRGRVDSLREVYKRHWSRILLDRTAGYQRHQEEQDGLVMQDVRPVEVSDEILEKLNYFRDDPDELLRLIDLDELRDYEQMLNLPELTSEVREQIRTAAAQRAERAAKSAGQRMQEVSSMLDIEVDVGGLVVVADADEPNVLRKGT
jgi:hypothetical protein